MKQFTTLTKEEKEALLQFPAYITLLADDSDGLLDQSEKKEAVKFSHIKTYSSDPLLASFYEETDKVFENNIQQIDKDLPSGKQQREAAIKNKLFDLEKIVLKLGKEYTVVMHRTYGRIDLLNLNYIK